MNTDNLSSNNRISKIEVTKYVLKRLCDWYYELNPNKEASDDNDISILKALKLIFLLSTVEHKNKSLLDNPFNDFVAMPLGPVETGIYSFFKANKHIIDYSKTYTKNLEYDIPLDYLNLVDNLIDVLKLKNIDLINKTAFYLVDLTHEWTCWTEAFALAEQNSLNSFELSTKNIKESKIKSYTF